MECINPREVITKEPELPFEVDSAPEPEPAPVPEPDPGPDPEPEPKGEPTALDRLKMWLANMLKDVAEWIKTFTVKKAKVFAVYFVDWKIIANFVANNSNFI